MSFRAQQRRSNDSQYVRVAVNPSPPESRSPSVTSHRSLTSHTSLASETDIESSEVELSDDQELDERTEIEKELFALVKKKEGGKVTEFLEQYHKIIDINKQDPDGISVLHQAVINNDENMVQVLIRDNEDIDDSDGLLHAVKENMVEMVSLILAWRDVRDHKPKNKRGKSRSAQDKGHVDASEYGDDLSPLQMAAICGHYELVEMLYERGERIEMPHRLSCTCNDCQGKSSTDLKRSNQRINLLKGLTNPAYIAFMTGADKDFDPVMYVFHIVGIIDQFMSDEPEFTSEYKEISEAVGAFPVDLLSLCRNMDETKTFLGNRDGYFGLSVVPYPRLLLAVDLKQKEFVAHKNSQDVLRQEWIGEPRNKEDSCCWWVCVTLSCLFFPFFSLIVLVLICFIANSGYCKRLIAPVNRCRSNTVSYVCFLAILYGMNAEGKNIGSLGPPAHYLPWAVGVYTICHILMFLRQYLISPNRRFFTGWNIFELLTYVAFIITFVLWIVLYFKGDIRMKHGSNKVHVMERMWLDCTDVLMLSEIFLAFASTMAGLRFLKIFLLHSTLGPLQMALGSMSKDIVTFFIFFVIIIVSFSLGVQHLYRSFIFTSPGKGGLFSHFNMAAEAFVWALFTMTDAATPKIKPISFMDKNGTNITNNYFLSQSVGKGIFVTFHIVCVTFLLNMLVGLMASTYGRIVGNIQVEWKFGRSRIWIHYIQELPIPPPFNIILAVISCICCTNCKACCCFRKDKTESHHTFGICSVFKLGTTDQDRKRQHREYRTLLRNLLQRYFRSKMHLASTDAPSTEDIKNVHLHIKQLREITEFTLEQTSKTHLTITHHHEEDSHDPEPPHPPPPSEPDNTDNAPKPPRAASHGAIKEKPKPEPKNPPPKIKSESLRNIHLKQRQREEPKQEDKEDNTRNIHLNIIHEAPGKRSSKPKDAHHSAEKVAKKEKDRKGSKETTVHTAADTSGPDETIIIELPAKQIKGRKQIADKPKATAIDQYRHPVSLPAMGKTH